jgi:hypothetical protein
MADSCTFTLYMELRDDLSPLELHTLDYLFNDRADRPGQWPEHEFFALDTPPFQMGGRHTFPEGAYVCASWRASDHPGMFSGIHYTCPNLKSHWFWQYHWYMARWLATLSASSGYVGSFWTQDDGKGLPWIFYVYERRLYMSAVDGTGKLFAGDGGDEC